MYGALARLNKSCEKGQKTVSPAVIAKYYIEKETGNLFSFLKEFVSDTSCSSITTTEEHVSMAAAYTDEKYMWTTRHDFMLLAKGYTYDEGKKYVEQILKGATSKAYPGKENDKPLRLLRVLKESIEGSKTEDSQTQKGGGTLIAQGDAARDFLDGVMARHAKRGKIHDSEGPADDDEDHDHEEHRKKDQEAK